MMDVPGWLQVSPKNPIEQQPYLRPSPSAVETWKHRLRRERDQLSALTGKAIHITKTR